MNFKSLIDRTKQINGRFKRNLDKQGRILDLVEEVGELANAILFVDHGKTSGNPDKIKTEDDIEDAVADILYDLILISELYSIDLPKAYDKMLDEMEDRFESGDLV